MSTQTAAQLRRAFDQAFAEEPELRASNLTPILTVRFGGAPHALRLSEIASIHTDRKLVRLPSPMPELLGLAALRNVLVPVYDLAACLGYPLEPPSRCFLLAKAPTPIGLACAAPEALRHVPSDAFSLAPSAGRSHFAGAVRIVDLLARGPARFDDELPLIDITSIVRRLEGAKTLHAKGG
jgi:purine-binding chemotaxis protein CheW